MYKKNKILLYIAVVILLFSTSCNDFLNEKVYTQYDPKSFLATTQGINSLLNAAYSHAARSGLNGHIIWTLNELPGDIMYDWGGGYENTATIYTNFSWDAQQTYLYTHWQYYYKGIQDANSLLDNIHFAKASLSEDKIEEIKSEAKFLRALDYYFLWRLFGTVPLVTTTNTKDVAPKRATDEEFNSFITGEFQAAAKGLPQTQDQWGKATKGAALAFLGEYYLNTHQWQDAVNINRQVMDMKLYHLYAGDLKYQFAVENEENSSVIFASCNLPTHGKDYASCFFPPSYQVQSNWTNFGTQMCVRNDFFKTYASNDKRRAWFLTNYTTIDGKHVDLLSPNNLGRSVRCFKYWPDPNAISSTFGNDIPYMRYAEVLLNLAEALNELNGPNQKSVDLLNKIRARAGVNEYSLADFPNKETLRNAMIKERGWEFVCENKRRMTLIRQGELISNAKERGIENVKKYMTLYPIPQNAIDVNSNLKQNPGY